MGKFEDIYEKRKNLLNDAKAKAASAAPAAVISKLNHVTLPPKEVPKDSTPKDSTPKDSTPKESTPKVCTHAPHTLPLSHGYLFTIPSPL
jgi:hypothetical protein